MHKCEICNNSKKFFQTVCEVCWSRIDHPAYYTKINNIMTNNTDIIVLKSETPRYELVEVLKNLLRDVE